MTERERPEAKRLTEAFGEPYRRMVQGAVETQQRNVRLAQGWAEGLTDVLRSQAEANRALTRAMESQVRVVEEALRSQERTNRALAESLEAYKDVVERTSALQDKSTDLVENFLGGVTKELRDAAEDSQAMARGMMEGSEMQMEAFQRMLGEAMQSYTNLMNAPFDLYQKNLESFGRRGEQGS